MKKFPLIRDLVVDRSRMFENLKKVKGWVPIDGSYDLGMAPPQDDGDTPGPLRSQSVHDLRLLRRGVSRR